MRMTIFENVYALTESGKKVAIGTVSEARDDIYRVGGMIFYIDSESTGAEYHFYDQNGREIHDVAVGDTPYAYSVSGTPTKDKYYIFKQEETYPVGTWTYMYNGEYVKEKVGIRTLFAIGNGKINTNYIMTVSDGAYANGADTIWNGIKTLNLTADNNDWYIPSKDELEALRTAEDAEGAALIPSIFIDVYNPIWTSCESAEESQDYATRWVYGDGWIGSGKHISCKYVPVRSF